MNHTESGQQDQLARRHVELSAHDPADCDELETRDRTHRQGHGAVGMTPHDDHHQRHQRSHAESQHVTDQIGTARRASHHDGDAGEAEPGRGQGGETVTGSRQPAAGVAAASHRGVPRRGVAGSADVSYTDGRYPSLEIGWPAAGVAAASHRGVPRRGVAGSADVSEPDMNGEQSPSRIREPRTSEHGDGGARSCVAQTASSS